MQANSVTLAKRNVHSPKRSPSSGETRDPVHRDTSISMLINLIIKDLGAARLLEVPHIHNLKQHVTVPTHKSKFTLD